MRLLKRCETVEELIERRRLRRRAAWSAVAALAQGVAATLVVGSYFLAEHVRVRLPRARADRAAAAAETA